MSHETVTGRQLTITEGLHQHTCFFQGLPDQRCQAQNQKNQTKKNQRLTFHLGERIKSITAHCLVGKCQFYLATRQFKHLKSMQKNTGMQQLSHCKGAQPCFAHQEKDIPWSSFSYPQGGRKLLQVLLGTQQCAGITMLWDGRRKQPDFLILINAICRMCWYGMWGKEKQDRV